MQLWNRSWYIGMVLSDKDKYLITNISDNSEFNIYEKIMNNTHTLLTSRELSWVKLYIEDPHSMGVLTIPTFPTEFSVFPTTDRRQLWQACSEGYTSTDLSLGLHLVPNARRNPSDVIADTMPFPSSVLSAWAESCPTQPWRYTVYPAVVERPRDLSYSTPLNLNLKQNLHSVP